MITGNTRTVHPYTQEGVGWRLGVAWRSVLGKKGKEEVKVRNHRK